MAQPGKPKPQPGRYPDMSSRPKKPMPDPAPPGGYQPGPPRPAPTGPEPVKPAPPGPVMQPLPGAPIATIPRMPGPPAPGGPMTRPVPGAPPFGAGYAGPPEAFTRMDLQRLLQALAMQAMAQGGGFTYR